MFEIETVKLNLRAKIGNGFNDIDDVSNNYLKALGEGKIEHTRISNYSELTEKEINVVLNYIKFDAEYHHGKNCELVYFFTKEEISRIFTKQNLKNIKLKKKRVSDFRKSEKLQYERLLVLLTFIKLAGFEGFRDQSEKSYNLVYKNKFVLKRGKYSSTILSVEKYFYLKHG